MRYQLPATLDVTVYLGDIFGSKHLATRALLQAARPAVIARCGTYDTALPRLQTPPILVWHPDTEAALQSCYTGGTKALSALKDDILTTLNIQSPVNLQRCPYCLLNDPRTWDHYLPKESYPEYSVYHANLLYVCFGCNHRGACQGSCRVIHAASSDISTAGELSLTTQSRSGLSVTGPIGDQSRVEPDQRAGLA